MEPSPDDAYKILKGLKSRFEEHHGSDTPTRRLRVASEISARYITDRFLPDKAIDVIDEAGAFQQLRGALQAEESIGVAISRPSLPKLHAFPRRRSVQTTRNVTRQTRGQS